MFLRQVLQIVDFVRQQVQFGRKRLTIAAASCSATFSSNLISSSVRSLEWQLALPEFNWSACDEVSQKIAIVGFALF